MALSIMQHHGWTPEEDRIAFQGAGYAQEHYLEVVTILAQKTLSNYYNHSAQTPLDAMFESQVWDK